jgi:hypothetical protein
MCLATVVTGKGCALEQRFSTWEPPRSSQWVWTYTVCRVNKQYIYISHMYYCISGMWICYCDEWIVKSFVTTVNEFVKRFLIIMYVFSLKSPDNATVRMWESAKFLWNQKGVIYWTRVGTTAALYTSLLMVTTAALYTSRLNVMKWH